MVVFGEREVITIDLVLLVDLTTELLAFTVAQPFFCYCCELSFVGMEDCILYH